MVWPYPTWVGTRKSHKAKKPLIEKAHKTKNTTGPKSPQGQKAHRATKPIKALVG